MATKSSQTGGASIADGPLGFILFAAYYTLYPPIATFSAVKEAVSLNNLNASAVKVYQFFNPSFLDEKIKTLSVRISTLSLLRSARTRSEWFTRRAIFYFLKQDYSSSEADLKQAIELDDTNFIAWYYLACVRYQSCVAAPNFFEIIEILTAAEKACDSRKDVAAIKQVLHNI